MALAIILLLAWGQASSRTVQAQGPAMSLTGPAQVDVGIPFTISVNADPAPNVDIGGFNTEVLFPRAVEWLQRASCEDEVQVVTDGNAPQFCIQYLSQLLQGAAHTVLSEVSEVAESPLAALDVTPGSTTTLVEIDFVCRTAGSHTLVLAVVQDSAFGSVYADLDAEPLLLETIEHDYDGDTTPNAVADILTLDCRSPQGTTEQPTGLAGETATPIEPGLTAVDGDNGDGDSSNGDNGDGGSSNGDSIAGDTDGGVSAGLWAVIAAVLAAAVAGLAAFGWRYARSR